jgi:hypothetical protein
MNTMRPTRLNARLPLVAALGAAIAATTLIGIARADDDGRTFGESIIHNVLTGIGLQDPNAVAPTYEERSPLAIPQSDTLPPPQKSGAAIAKNPAWPNDPDVLRAKAHAANEKNRDLAAEMERDSHPLRPDQIGPKYPGTRSASRSTGSGNDADPFDGVARISPSQLGYQGGVFGSLFGSDKENEETARFTGEPARGSLTEPPPGYQTPSPTQPYGVGANNAPPKPEDYLMTHGTQY